MLADRVGQLCACGGHGRRGAFLCGNEIQTGIEISFATTHMLARSVCAQVVLEIAMDAPAEERTPSLAMIYDEMLRKKIENKCGQLGEAFDIAGQLASTDEVVLRWAKR